VRAISKRLGKLEERFGLVDTEARRHARERAETLRRRFDARRTLEGLPPLEPDLDGQDLTDLSRSEIPRLHFKALKPPATAREFR